MLIQHILLSLSGIKPKELIKLSELLGGTAGIFEAGAHTLQKEYGVSAAWTKKLFSEEQRKRAEKECEFIYRNNISVRCFGTENYPRLLEQCPDAPMTLYTKGEIDFNACSKKWIAFVGTRNPTTHGEEACAVLVEQLAKQHKDMVLVSGLAYGIDGRAHREALRNGIRTVAVLPNGLDTIQPSAHFDLANRIVDSGGALVTEYPSNTPVFRFNFPARNRIIAGLSAATVVVESPEKGGSMITARMADGYHRDVFALPGRFNDPTFAGCNNLIKNSTAQLIQSADDIEYYLNWEREPVLSDLFGPVLEGLERKVYDCFERNSELTADEIAEQLDISVSEVYPAALELEFSGLIKSVRGKSYIKL